MQDASPAAAPDYDVIADGLAFPEGPVAMADGSVIVVELAAGRITRCWNGRTEVVAEPGGGPNGAAIGPDGALYVCNSGGIDLVRLQNATGPGNEGRIERIDLATGKVERVYERAGDIPLSAPNDLVIDEQGEIWFTDLGKHYDRIHEQSALFRAACDGSAIAEVYKGESYNGVGLSPDGRWVYVADTHQARIYRFDRDAPGAPHFVATVPGPVGLDSLAVTASGNICVGRIHEGGIATVTPGGAVSAVAFPDPFTTNIAFGGSDMRSAHITLSATGRLIRTTWPEAGLRLCHNG
ncbi:gluconolactonase [Sphingopyxis lindanitolerans]|uniref:Gluconolactonase n=1 Tax=Sphingopyxis lindanitolerans TaxID=2054227 RepID=A0A2S8B5W7_9SPHN|nr:SMP-30/gluconolactonase/LRE family protein [Sphingopyxis lindanitolerans]PQM27738.1 gluconolactonase [Sphingopyxis lindanitolerans]